MLIRWGLGDKRVCVFVEPWTLGFLFNLAVVLSWTVRYPDFLGVRWILFLAGRSVFCIFGPEIRLLLRTRDEIFPLDIHGFLVHILRVILNSLLRVWVHLTQVFELALLAVSFYIGSHRSFVILFWWPFIWVAGRVILQSTRCWWHWWLGRKRNEWLGSGLWSILLPFLLHKFLFLIQIKVRDLIICCGETIWTERALPCILPWSSFILP